jgi:hypothetical protein
MAALLTFSPNPMLARAASYFDMTFFFLLGIAGCVMLFMWLGTAHQVCRNNFNLIWALPTHLVAAFYVKRPGKVMGTYFRVIFFLTLFLLLLGWLIQQFNSAVVPICLIILLRSWQLSQKFHDAGKIRFIPK